MKTKTTLTTKEKKKEKSLLLLRNSYLDSFVFESLPLLGTWRACSSQLVQQSSETLFLLFEPTTKWDKTEQVTHFISSPTVFKHAIYDIPLNPGNGVSCDQSYACPPRMITLMKCLLIFCLLSICFFPHSNRCHSQRHAARSQHFFQRDRYVILGAWRCEY